MSEATERLDRSIAQARHWISIGRAERALEALSHAGPAAADEPETFLLTALAHLDLEHRTDAARAASDGLALDPGDPRLLEALGIAQWRSGDRPAAERAFLAGLSEAPDSPHLLARYALLVAEVGQLDKAQRLVDRAAALAPQNALVGQVRSLVAYLRGDDKAATEIGTAALANAPEDAGLHALMGSYLLESGSVGRATAHHLTSASIDPENRDVRELGVQAKYLRHPLMRPMWFVEKVGPGKIWIGWVLVLFALRGAGLDEVVAVATVLYLSFALYTWVVPPILRRRYGIRS